MGEEIRTKLIDASPEDWDRLIESVRPPLLLALIRARLRGPLSRWATPEDIWQEVLLSAWKQRASFEWRDPASFRRWMIRIAQNKIRDLADHIQAEKRGAGRDAQPFSTLAGPDSSNTTLTELLGPLSSTTPSRVAAFHEESERISAALERLPDELKEVVRLRLLEEKTMQEVADELGIGLSAARHRFRKGAALYEELLESELA